MGSDQARVDADKDHGGKGNFKYRHVKAGGEDRGATSKATLAHLYYPSEENMKMRAAYLIRGKAIPKEIVREVAAKHGVSVLEIIGRKRNAQAVAARWEVEWRLHYEFGFNMTHIGRMFGWDHTSVRHGVLRHEEKMNGKD